MNLKTFIDFNLLPFDRICEKIRLGQHFSLARYGDGEFNAIFGRDGANCDHHPYFPEMGRELARILSSQPPYYLGLHQSAKIQEETLNWLSFNGYIEEVEESDGGVSLMPVRRFVPNSVFHDALVGKDKNEHRAIPRPGMINGLWNALNERAATTIIAPGYVKDQSVISCGNFIEIPGKDTYLNMTQIWIDICKHDLRGCVVLICASMCAPILVDKLYWAYGDAATFVDFGSVFDPFTPGSPFTRSFHKRIEV